MVNIFDKISDPKTNIVGMRKIWFLIPCCILVIGLIVLLIFGMNVGIDFSGGMTIEVYAGETALAGEGYNTYKNEISELVVQNGGSVSYDQKSGDNCIIVKCQNVGNDEQMAELQTKVEEALRNKYSDLYAQSATNITVSFTGSSVSGQLLSRALVAVAVASALMLIYIWLRFDLFSGLAAVIALLHDTFMMIALTIIFQIQVNTSFMAAVITIIAYSINATIVLFDRARELKKQDISDKFDPEAIANTAIKNTFKRSLYSTLTTLITVLLLAILSVATIREFALPIIFGLISGLFSSICIAPSIWVVFQNAKMRKSK